MAIRADDVDLDRDRALVQRFQAGDGAAFDELYIRYHDRLERFCLKRVGDQYAAEEVAQEAFTRALKALPALGGERRFYPWVSVIASRLCVDHHRREARSEPTPDLDLGAVPGGQDAVVDAVDVELVNEAMGRLHPRHQDVLHLREVEGMSYRQIAEHYDVAIGTIETLLFRARRALRKEFHVVDGAGLAALPFVGWLIHAFARVRDRLQPLTAISTAPSTIAAAATATAAAVVIAIVPGGATPTPVTQVPPAISGPAAVPGGRGAGAGVGAGVGLPSLPATPPAPPAAGVAPGQVGSEPTPSVAGAAGHSTDSAVTGAGAAAPVDPTATAPATTVPAAGPIAGLPPTTPGSLPAPGPLTNLVNPITGLLPPVSLPGPAPGALVPLAPPVDLDNIPAAVVPDAGASALSAALNPVLSLLH